MDISRENDVIDLTGFNEREIGMFCVRLAVSFRKYSIPCGLRASADKVILGGD